MSKKKVVIPFSEIEKQVRKASQLFTSLKDFKVIIYKDKKNYSRKIKHKKKDLDTQ